METFDSSSLCYHCKVHKTGRICFKDEPVSSPKESNDTNSTGLLKGINGPLYSAYVKTVVLKTIFATFLSDCINYLRDREIDQKFEIINKDKSEFEYSSLPDYIRRCERCLCYFSLKVPCHCSGCSDSPVSHYVILLHGILSSPLMMTDSCRVLMEKHPSLFVYFPVCACGKTLHGTSVVLKFLIDELNMLFSKLPTDIKVSMLGHSFGGVLIRYFFLNYVKNLEADTIKGKRRKSTDKNITWKNLICVATPHAGIYEDNREFRKFVSIMGSETVNELENETIDLLFLLKDDVYVNHFEKISVYGNISGDMIVAPRTSIILPYHKYSEADLETIQKFLLKIPGSPTNINKIFTDRVASQSTEIGDDAETNSDPNELEYTKNIESKASDDNFRYSDTDDEHDGPSDSVTKELIAKFNEMVNKKMSKSKSLKYLQDLVASNTPKEAFSHDEHPSSPSKSKSKSKSKSSKNQLFTNSDFDMFNGIIAEIVRDSDQALLKRLREDDALLYFEVLLSLTHKMAASKYAVYIPRINMPHRSIISLQTPVTQESYTLEILNHIADSFCF